MTHRARPFALCAGLLAAVGATVAWADDPAFGLSIRDHRFSPAQIEIPANTKVRLVIRNEDTSPEEFDSTQLRRERVIPGRSEATIYVGPLPPGTYEFIGEFHADTARGRLVVR
jgi:Cupredoxin-like domain